MSFILSEKADDSLPMSESEIDNDLCHVGDKPVGVHSSICIVGDHQGMKPSGWKLVVLCEIHVHD